MNQADDWRQAVIGRRCERCLHELSMQIQIMSFIVSLFSEYMSFRCFALFLQVLRTFSKVCVVLHDY
jgi:hypothetical protein